MLILLSLKIIAYTLLSIIGNASCIMIPKVNTTMINATISGINITNVASEVTVLNLTLVNNYAEELMALGNAFCKGPFGEVYIINGEAYLVNSTSGGLMVGVSNMFNITEVTMPCLTVIMPSNVTVSPSLIDLINLRISLPIECLTIIKVNNTASVFNESSTHINYTASIILSSLIPLTFNAYINGTFNIFTYGAGSGSGGYFPTSILLVIKSAELVARVTSKVPVYLRFYVFDNVTRGYSLNYTLRPIITPVKVPYVIPIYTGGAVNCTLYNITVYFTHPESVVPIPVPVNEGEPFLVVKYVEVDYINPSSQMFLVEPGKVLMVSNPVSEVGYRVDVCRINESETNVISDPYALLYKSTLPMPVSLNATNPIEASVIMAKLFQNKTIQARVSELFNSTWSPLVASAAAMYLYRDLGYPSRVILGTIPIKYYGNEYLEYGYLPWVEFYYNGWVEFKPYKGLPISSSGGLGKLLTEYGVNYVSVSLLLVLPALLIYYLYLYLTSRGIYGE